MIDNGLRRCLGLALASGVVAAGVVGAAAAAPSRVIAGSLAPGSSGAAWWCCPQDIEDRALPGGGRVLVARDPEATRVTLRIGFPAELAEGALARLAASLQEACDQSLARALTAADATLVIEHDGDSLVAVLEASHDAHAELLGPTLRVLTTPPRGPARPPIGEPLSTRLLRVDLAGRSTWLGPAPDGRASTAAVAAALLALDGTERAGPSSNGLGSNGLGSNGLGPNGLGPDGLGPDGRAAYEAARAELVDLAARTVRRDALVLGIVGDVDVEGALALAAESAALVPERERGPAPATAPLVVPLTSEVWVAANAERSVGAVVLLGRGCRADAPDTAAVLVLEELIVEALAIELAPVLGISGAGGESAERSLGFRATPGFRRGGRLVAWFGGPAEEVARAGEQLRELLTRDQSVSLPAEAARIERARSRALARLALAESPRERLLQEHRLALRGVAAGTRARLAAEVSKLTASALVDAAARYLTADAFLCVAATRSDLVADLAVLGTLVTLPELPPASAAAPGEAPAPTTREGERATAEVELRQLLEAVGGRAGWASVRAAELSMRLSRAGVTLRARATLDLEGTRFVLRVEEGGETVLDETGAVWRCFGNEHRLDASALAHDARLGLLGLLHRLARGGSSSVQRAAEGLVVEVDGRELCFLELDAKGRPVRLSTRDGAPRAWRFEGWRSAGTLQVPARIIDELREVTMEVDSCLFLDRYEPSR